MDFFKRLDYAMWLSPLLVLCAAVLFYSSKKRKTILKRNFSEKALARLTDPFSVKMRNVKVYLLAACVFFLCVSLWGPQWGLEPVAVGETGGNIVFAVDTSLSMLAKDLSPSRLENSKLMLRSLVDDFKDYRIAIVTFSGKAFLQCPPTLDREAVKYFISSIKAGMLPYKGTDLSDALLKSAEVFKTLPGEKTVVLLTDGEDFSGNLGEVLKKIKKNGVRVFAVGIGSKDGELVPVMDENGKFTGYKKDDKKNTVVTKLNENVLRRIARETGGAYAHYGDPENVAAVIRDSVGGNRKFKEKHSLNFFKNRYQIPLFAAFILLLAEILAPERRFAWKKLLSPKKLRSSFRS